MSGIKRGVLLVAMYGIILVLVAALYYWDYKEQKERRTRNVGPECQLDVCEYVWRV